jgi:hypothetical protein
MLTLVQDVEADARAKEHSIVEPRKCGWGKTKSRIVEVEAAVEVQVQNEK